MTNLNPEIPKDYYLPRENDPHVQEILNKLGLPPDASLAQVEPIAKALLAFDGGQPVGASLVMGRRVNLNETELLGSVMAAMNGTEAYKAILPFRQAEIQARAQQKQ